MNLHTIKSLVLLAVVAAAAVALNPALRSKLSARLGQITSWDEEARRADPEGFARYAERKLREDLEKMQATRRELAAEVGQIARKVREQEALVGHAQAMAEDFRGQYRLASSGGRFPVEVRGAAYTEDQVRSQVSMLLAEAEGYDTTLAQLRDVRTQAQQEMETLAVKVDATEAQLAGLAAQRGLLRARRLTTEGEELLAQVNDLLSGNARVIEGNPVRTVRELLASETGKPRTPSAVTAADRVERFLHGTIAQEPGAEPQTGFVETVSSTIEPPIQAQVAPVRGSHKVAYAARGEQ